MSLGPQEIVRSEVEGGLTGPANSLTAESIDCGCGQFKLPRLAKFATRRIFLALLCSIGVLQAAAQGYLYVTSSTIARTFEIDPYLMEWILCMSEIATILLGLVVSYWGDRFHRASWLGGLALIQCASFFALLIPHFSNFAQVIDDSDNVNATHMSIYAEDSPDLCMKTSAGLYMPKDPPHYSTLFILITVQVVTAMANIAYYALGISYLDDNTKRLHVSVYFAVVFATRILGSVLGYLIGWGFLRIDANDFSPITSYRTQVGAWWLGWPILAVVLAIPSIFMAIFPRKLPSEMVEIAAATILDQSGTLRDSQRLAIKKVGSPEFFPSMLRLVTNKILICNILAGAFLMTGLLNFIANENIFLESRFYAPRPAGMFLGFGDPLISRVITTITKPILIGLSVIITGLVIARAKPRARTLVNYSFVVLVLSALVIFCLAFDNCQKRPIQGLGRGELMTKVCNKDCRCSRDADFRPVCDIKGVNTYYSPCHAGCSSVDYDNSNKIYSNCSCVIIENSQAREGPCGSDGCQIGWIFYEILTMLVYAAAASTLIGDLIISLRSVNDQDKALTIGHGMAILGFFAYIPGKFAYDELAKSTCQYWGHKDHVCRLHHSTDLGNYLCFLTAGLIIISAIFKIGVGFFCKDLEIYDPSEVVVDGSRELKDMSKPQEEPLLQTSSTSQIDNQPTETAENSTGPVIIIEHKKLGSKENGPIDDSIATGEASGSRLKYGPVGPGDKRTDHRYSNVGEKNADTDDELDSSDGSQVPRKGSASQVSYKPLELDSDVESDLSGTGARSRKRISSTDADDPSKVPSEIRPPFSNLRFPNPENYNNPRLERTNSPNLGADGSTKTNSFEFSKKPKDDKPLSASRGDFNELGIPIIESYEATIKGSISSLRSPTIMMTMQQLNQNPTAEYLEEKFYRSLEKNNTTEVEENRKFRLENLMQPVNFSPESIRPPSRDQASSGFGSLQDMHERMRLHSEISDSKDSLSSKSSTSGPPKKGGPLCTDL